MTIPTLVIGMGMGGIRVVQTFADVVNEAKQREFYEFVAIDSNRKDLSEVIRSGQGIQTVPIDETGYAIDHDPEGRVSLRRRISNRGWGYPGSCLCQVFIRSEF